MTAAASGGATAGHVAKDPKSHPESQDRLEEYLKLMDEENRHELEIRHGPFQVKLVRQPASAPRTTGATAGKPAADAAEKIKGTPIKSPLAGVFYRSPSPQSAPFVNEGDVVSADKTLCLVEAMKVMNEITAGVSGTVLRIMVENGKPVQAGQILFVIEPTK